MLLHRLGNTQDITIRKYLLDNGFKTTENGGNVTSRTCSKSRHTDTISKKANRWCMGPRTMGELRLVKELMGRVFLDERNLMAF